MSAPRLTFLYPHLFKPARIGGSNLTHQPSRDRRRPGQRAGFTTSKTCRQEAYAQRYGPANDPASPPPLPPPPPSSKGDSGDPKSLATAIEKEVKTPITKLEEKKTEPAQKVSEPTASARTSQEGKDSPGKASDPKLQGTEKSIEVDASESHPKENIQVTKSGPVTKPLERVLQMGSPEDHKPPHLQAPPYVHHFDTFTLVKNLQKGGFTEAQSVTLMKAVRGLLAQNLDIAREGLVSKSDVENETYLFRAACSELRTEILSLRRASSTTQATQRAHLQHTFDILSQRASQESLAMKDDLRGLFNDRKMDVRAQQQARDSAIQELNYKITVSLNSGSKTEVEGLRWFLVRRAVGTIAVLVVLGLGMVRYSASRHRAKEEERKRIEAENGGGTSPGGGGGDRYTVKSREMGTQTAKGGAEEMLVKSVDAGVGPSYVSLG